MTNRRIAIDGGMVAGFGGLLLLIIVIGLIGIQQIQGLAKVVAQLAEVEIPLQNAVLEMKANDIKYAIGIRSYIFWRQAKNTDPQVLQEKLDWAHSAAKEFDSYLAFYGTLALEGRPREWVQTVRIYENELRQIGARILSLADKLETMPDAEKQANEKVMNSLLTDFESRLFWLDSFLNEPIQKFNSPKLARHLVAVEVGRRRSVVFLGWSLVVGLSLGAQTVFLIYRRSKKEREHREFLWRKVVTIQEEDRNHLAMQIHDEMGQDLSALKIFLGLLDKDLAGQSPDARERIERMKKILDGLMTKTHNISELLRPPELDEVGLVESISGLIVKHKEMTQASYNFTSPKEALVLPAQESLVLYRLVQEGLTNIAKYSHAQHIEIALRKKDHWVYLAIADDGVGFDAESYLRSPMRRKEDKVRLGLQSLKERIELLGGELRIHSRPGAGTRLEAGFPVD